MPTPPAGAREEARRGLAWRQEFRRGGTLVGVARARDLANGADLSPDTIRRMVSFFARHEIDKQGQGWSPGEPGYPSAGRIAWALWGGDAGRSWAKSQSERMSKGMSEPTEERRPSRLRRLRITRVDRVAAGANPDAHVVLFKNSDDPTPSGTDVLDYPPSDLSAEEQPTEMETHEMTVDRETLTPEVAALLAEAEAERDAALAKAADLEAAAAAIDPEPEPTDEPTDDEVLKALDPSVRERIAKAEAEREALAERVAKMEDEALTATFVAKAAEFRTVENDADTLGAALKDVAKNCDAATAETIDRVLKSAAGRLDEAHRLITAEIGTTGALDMTDAGRQIEALAKARSEQTGETLPVATAAVLNDNPDLYEQARAQRA